MYALEGGAPVVNGRVKTYVGLIVGRVLRSSRASSRSRTRFRRVRADARRRAVPERWRFKVQAPDGCGIFTRIVPWANQLGVHRGTASDPPARNHSISRDFRLAPGGGTKRVRTNPHKSTLSHTRDNASGVSHDRQRRPSLTGKVVFQCERLRRQRACCRKVNRNAVRAPAAAVTANLLGRLTELRIV